MSSNAPAAPAAAPAHTGPLRTVLCTRGGLFGALVLGRLRACPRLQICGIVRSTRVFDARYGLWRGAAAYLGRSGLIYTLYLFCVTTLADLACALLRADAVPLSRRGRIPVHTTRDINAPEGLRFLEQCAPDLLISAFFDQRLHAQALAIPRCAALNIHPSLLPRFRGVEPVLQTRLQAGELGVSVHYMTPILDDGPLLSQQAIAVPATASLFAATAQLFRAGADLLCHGIERLRQGESGRAQRGDPSYQSWPTRADLHAYRRRGGALMRVSDWARIGRRSMGTELNPHPPHTHNMSLVSAGGDLRGGASPRRLGRGAARRGTGARGARRGSAWRRH